MHTFREILCSSKISHHPRLVRGTYLLTKKYSALHELKYKISTKQGSTVKFLNLTFSWSIASQFGSSSLSLSSTTSQRINYQQKILWTVFNYALNYTDARWITYKTALVVFQISNTVELRAIVISLPRRLRINVTSPLSYIHSLRTTRVDVILVANNKGNSFIAL